MVPSRLVSRLEMSLITYFPCLTYLLILRMERTLCSVQGYRIYTLQSFVFESFQSWVLSNSLIGVKVK